MVLSVGCFLSTPRCLLVERWERMTSCGSGCVWVWINVWNGVDELTLSHISTSTYRLCYIHVRTYICIYTTLMLMCSMLQPYASLIHSNYYQYIQVTNRLWTWAVGHFFFSMYMITCLSFLFLFLPIMYKSITYHLRAAAFWRFTSTAAFPAACYIVIGQKQACHWTEAGMSLDWGKPVIGQRQACHWTEASLSLDSGKSVIG